MLIAARVATDVAQRTLGQVKTLGTSVDNRFDPANGLRQQIGFVGGTIQQMIREPFGRFASDTGQRCKSFDQVPDGRTVRMPRRLFNPCHKS
jgi:hypothetical protein